MINDEECDVDLPSPVDDGDLPVSGARVRGSESPSTKSLLPTIQVVRGISQLLKALRAATLTPLVLQSFDLLFGDCVAAFPTHHHIRSDGYLEPYALPPLLHLQNARLVLHRHNLMVISPPEARSAAIHHCVIVAQDTARLLSRCMQAPPDASRQPPSHYDKWETRLALAASTFFCTHMWRCTLFLCFRGVYDAALLCARVSAIMGEARPVNTRCGQYLEFFLGQLTAKLQRREGASFDDDEEMIAYVSADLQGSSETSWVWQGVEDDIRLSERLKRPVSADSGKTNERLREATAQEENSDWAGWERILAILEQLVRWQQREQQHLTPQGFPPRMQQVAAQAASPSNPGLLQDSPASSNRISIANII
jgi:hypothetical protein